MFGIAESGETNPLSSPLFLKWRNDDDEKKLYELMEDGNLGYACAIKRKNRRMHTDCLRWQQKTLPILLETMFTKIIMMDMCDRLICEKVSEDF